MVSVIIPNYCHAPYLRQRIDSVLAQSYPDFEVVLLDDCSTDGSRECTNEMGAAWAMDGKRILPFKFPLKIPQNT